MSAVRRLPIYKYNKSGKLSGITPNPRLQCYIVIDMSPDLREIHKVRYINHLRRDLTSPTEYIMEVTEDAVAGSDNKNLYRYRLLRILTLNDLDENKWKNAQSLSDLPIAAR